jgi:hypothetical protein
MCFLMMKKMGGWPAATAVLLLLLSGAVLAGEHRILKLDNFKLGEVRCAAFEVKSPLDVDIYAVGSSQSGNSQLAGYGWIIRAGSLEPVWVMERHNTDPIPDKIHLREYDSSIELEPGLYRAYFYAGTSWGSGRFDPQVRDLGDLYRFLEKLLTDDLLEELQGVAEELQQELAQLEQELETAGEPGEEDEKATGEQRREYAEKWAEQWEKEWTEEWSKWEAEGAKLKDKAGDLIENYVLDISAASDDFSHSECKSVSERAIVEILRPEHNLYSSVGFTLSKPMEVEIIAIGEYSIFDDAFVDHGWLKDAETRDYIWTMTNANTRHAGGDDKNRAAQEVVWLDAGDYLVYYSTDDSHSFDDFNAPPPYNPHAYGIQVNALSQEELQNVTPYRDTYSESALIAITQVGDDECVRRYIQITEPCRFRVYAIGEFDEYNDEFCDYGWIERVDQRQVAWRMERGNTRHAGGAAKNRLFDDVVHFDEGTYTLGYVTDGSHSYGSFNAAPPFDQKNYGVTLYGVTDDCDQSVLRELSSIAEIDGETVAKLTCMGDDARVKQSFVLDKPGKIRIYAIGEGDERGMYDYGWLERADDGEVVWEMTYRMTEPAGGAKKNRLVNSVLLLDEGEYEVWFVSDGSHSFASWNAPRPRDPESWGITISKLKE